MNNNPEIIQKWIDRITYDMDTASAMLQTRRLIYVIFMCQQSIEKCLKALLVFQGKEAIPVHNLRRLGELSGIMGEIEPSRLTMLDFLSRFYLNARYKEDINELSRGITEDIAREYMAFTKEFIEWLYQKMKR